MYTVGPPLFLPCILNWRGRYRIYKVQIHETQDNEDYFAICFEEERITILGQTKKITGAYLYEIFIKQGAIFNSNIPQAHLNRLLFEFFYHKISSSNEIWDVSAKAGWFKGFFYHNGKMPLDFKKLFTNAPIVQNFFEELPIEENTFEIYTKELFCFTDTTTRYLVAVYPFISLMSSLFEGGKIDFAFSLNFVMACDCNKLKICEFLQIFNRSHLHFQSTKITKKELSKRLSTLKDEVLIADFTDYAENDYHRKKTKEHTYHMLQDYFNGNVFVNEPVPRKLCAGLVTLSDTVIPRRDVFNIIIDDEFKAKAFSSNNFFKSQCMDRIFSQFVNFVEQKKNLDEIFNRKRSETTQAGVVFSIIDELLTEFWEKHGVNFHEELNFNNMNFDEVIGTVEDIETDELDIFINCFRNAVKNYFIIEKHSPSASDNAIIYNSECVWIPVSIFNEICTKINMGSIRKKILLKLRENGSLIVDSGSLSRVIQIRKERFECYQITRNTFTKTGEIDFTNLGKQEENNVKTV